MLMPLMVKDGDHCLFLVRLPQSNPTTILPYHWLTILLKQVRISTLVCVDADLLCKPPGMHIA